MTRRTNTDDMPCLDIRYLKRNGCLVENRSTTISWSRNKRRTASIELTAHQTYLRLAYQFNNQAYEYDIHYTYTDCHLGGKRHWFICPQCGKRVACLYGGGVFSCRTCHNLVYPVTQENKLEREARKLNNIRASLGWENGFLWGYGGKPKHMHWKTYHKIMAKYEPLEAQLEAKFMELLRK